MENAVDALKMAFGILVFVIAIALAVSVIGQARAASDVIFHSNDKTEFYEYITSEDVDSEDRIVGIDTIIPTIHRYANEQFAVSIYDEKGNPIVRYDLWTEGIMPNWDEIVRKKDKGPKYESLLNTYNEVNDRLQMIQKIVNKTIKTNKELDTPEIIDKLYKVEGNNIKHRSTMGWK